MTDIVRWKNGVPKSTKRSVPEICLSENILDWNYPVDARTGIPTPCSDLEYKNRKENCQEQFLAIRSLKKKSRLAAIVFIIGAVGLILLHFKF